MMRRHLPLLLGLSALLVSCVAPRASAGDIQILVRADQQEIAVAIPAGSTSLQAIDAAGLELGPADRVDPPTYTLLSDGTVVEVTRVIERFEIETEVVPFERQTIRNESMPEGETRLLQPGVNGLQEVTYRLVEESGAVTSRTPVKIVVAQDPVPEIIMIGAQISYAPVAVDGTLAYLSGGNAWVIREDTRNRRPLVVTGDLDGRIFRLSPDGRFLLYSRTAPDDSGDINSLWLISTVEDEPDPIDLKLKNVVHFADWSPQSIDGYTIAYSTAEPSPGAPGWQANNDLALLTLSFAGRVTERQEVVEANAGGQYGWWGTTFAWSPDGASLAYARADGIGLVVLDAPAMQPLVEIQPFQSFSDWAWVPGLAWGGDGQSLYYIDHGQPTGLEDAASSPVFDLAAWIGDAGEEVVLVSQTGMFSYPAISPTQPHPGGELAYQVAYLQALTPLESQTSGYQLTVLDRDGSNPVALFPPAGEAGMSPRPLAWSPGGDRLAVLHRGDLWIVDTATGQGQRVTGDSQTAAMHWAG